MSYSLLSHGKALALAIQGLIALDNVEFENGIIETKLRTQLIRFYQQNLKQILVNLTDEEINEILAILNPREGPITYDPSLN